LLRLNVLSPGDIFGLVAGTQNTTGATNFMRLIQVKDDAEQSNQAAGNSTAATVIS
jgi:hypothetical protein